MSQSAQKYIRIEPLIEAKREEEICLKRYFLDYLIANGFDDRSIVSVLEISNRVEDSISIMLPKDRYNPFLIVPELNDDEVLNYRKHELQGCSYNLNHTPKKRSKQMTETIELEGFDAAITMGFTDYKKRAILEIIGMQKFFGDCVIYKDKRDKENLKRLYANALITMNEQSDEEYTIVTDTIKEENIGLYLIKKKY